MKKLIAALMIATLALAGCSSVQKGSVDAFVNQEIANGTVTTAVEVATAASLNALKSNAQFANIVKYIKLVAPAMVAYKGPVDPAFVTAFLNQYVPSGEQPITSIIIPIVVQEYNLYYSKYTDAGTGVNTVTMLSLLHTIGNALQSGLVLSGN